MLGRSVGGLVLDGASLRPRPARALLGQLAELSRLGMHVVVLTTDSVLGTAEALGTVELGPGRLWVVGDDGIVGVPDSGRVCCAESGRTAALALLSREGVTGELVLETGPPSVETMLAEQIRRARTRRVPSIDHDPAWTIVERGTDAARHRVTESLFTLSTGRVGLRGSVEENPAFGQPLVVAAGVYDGRGPQGGLLPGPDALNLQLTSPVGTDVRTLDLRTGVLLREEVAAGVPLRSLRFGSITEPGVFALRVEAARARMRLPAVRTRRSWTQVTSGAGGIGAASEEQVGRDDEVATDQQIIAFDASATRPPARASAQARLDRASGRGFERLLAEQRATWASRWQAVDVRIPSDPWTERALRFALFHLWSLAGPGDVDHELAVGARGLTGSAYRGHVFWDADVFVLPALMTIAPDAAAAIVAYRLRRIRAARARARADGHAGARFPWESAYDGFDVTPDSGFVGSETVPILTGRREEHITADVAWAMARNATWTRPHGSLEGQETILLRDTARYWASRIRQDDDGTAHIEGVIGPDEYHELVDDDAFTNGMARWNLRAAARATRRHDAECATWLRLADALVDGYDADRSLHEQFRGYFQLEALTIRDLAVPPVAADVLAGRERIAASQIIKQPDVLMLHHLIPEEVRPGTLDADFDFYAPRTSHGSSLSPAVMASVAARANRADVALDLLRLSLRIDLDDIGGTAAAGVHIGACGGAWQAVIVGFLGARVVDGVLELDPVLPDAWPSVEARFRCLGRDVRVQVDMQVRVEASGPLHVRVTHGRGVAGTHVELHEEGQG